MLTETLQNISKMYQGRTVTLTFDQFVTIISNAYSSGILDLIGEYESEQFDMNFTDQYIEDLGTIYALDNMENIDRFFTPTNTN